MGFLRKYPRDHGMALLMVIGILIVSTGVLAVFLHKSSTKMTVASLETKKNRVREVAQGALRVGMAYLNQNSADPGCVLPKTGFPTGNCSGTFQEKGSSGNVEYTIRFEDNADEDPSLPDTDSDGAIYILSEAWDSTGTRVSLRALGSPENKGTILGAATFGGTLDANDSDPFLIVSGSGCADVPSLVVGGDLECDYEDRFWNSSSVRVRGNIQCHGSDDVANPSDEDDPPLLYENRNPSSWPSGLSPDIDVAEHLGANMTLPSQDACPVTEYEDRANLILLPNGGGLYLKNLGITWAPRTNGCWDTSDSVPHYWDNVKKQYVLCTTADLNNGTLYSKEDLRIETQLGDAGNGTVSGASPLRTTIISEKNIDLVDTYENALYYNPNEPTKALLVAQGDIRVDNATFGTGNGNISRYKGSICANDNVQLGNGLAPPSGPCFHRDNSTTGQNYGCMMWSSPTNHWLGSAVYEGQVYAGDQGSGLLINKSKLSQGVTIIYDCNSPQVVKNPTTVQLFSYLEE